MLADRYAPLVKANAVSKQEYDNAVASYRQAEAAVAAAKAAQDNASINLGYTDVTSPITGRIGKPLVTEGALVEGTSATQMATVQQLDPIYIDFNQSTTDLAALRRAFASGKLQQVGKDAARATVVLEDGSSIRTRASSCSPASRSTRPPVRSTCAPKCRTRTTCCCRACMCA